MLVRSTALNALLILVPRAIEPGTVTVPVPVPVHDLQKNLTDLYLSSDPAIRRTQGTFQSMEVRHSNFAGFIDYLTGNTYVMVIMSDPTIRKPFFHSKGDMSSFSPPNCIDCLLFGTDHPHVCVSYFATTVDE